MDSHVISLILAFMAMEAVALLVWFQRTGRGIPPAAAVVNLAAGASLMLALRLGLHDAPIETPVQVCLLVALVAHVADLSQRWRR